MTLLSASALPDVQAAADPRGIALDEVGVSGVALPVVGDRSGKLDHTSLPGYSHIARDGHCPARQRIDGEHCLVIVVIDVRQEVQLTLGHAESGSREP